MRDPIQRILSWSRGAERLYGWTAQEALGHISHTLLQTRFPTNRLAIEAQLERDGQWEGELVPIDRRQGQYVFLQPSSFTLIRGRGAPLYTSPSRGLSGLFRVLDQREQSSHLIASLTGIHQVRENMAMEQIVTAGRAPGVERDVIGSPWHHGDGIELLWLR